MSRKYSSLILSIVFACSSAVAMASNDYNTEKLNEVVARLKDTGSDATLVAAVNKQNAENLSMSTINSRDKKWQATLPVTLSAATLLHPIPPNSIQPSAFR